MNRDEAQHWNGYQYYPTSGILIFSDEVVKMDFYTTMSG